MERPWEFLETINNGYNFPTGHSIAWCLTDYFPMSNKREQQFVGGREEAAACGAEYLVTNLVII